MKMKNSNILRAIASLLLFGITATRCAGSELLEHLQAYIEESSENLDWIYDDMANDASQLLAMTDEQRKQAGKRQAIAWAHGRTTDPFLSVFSDALDPSHKRERRSGPNWPVWVSTIDASGSGVNNVLYQVGSLRVAQAFVAAKGWRWRTHYIYPVDGKQSDGPIWNINDLNIWAAVFKPETGIEVLLGFELGAYYEKIIYENSKRNSVRELLSKYFARCISENVPACRIGWALRQKDNGRHGKALKDIIQLAESTTYGAKLAGDYFGAHYELSPRFELAERYWLKAAALGDPSSMREVGTLYTALNDVEFKNIDVAKGEQYLQRAIEAGDAFAPRLLVESHEKYDRTDSGQDRKLMLIGAARDDAEAYLWLAEKSFAEIAQREQACKWLSKAKKLNSELIGSFALNKACKL